MPDTLVRLIPISSDRGDIDIPQEDWDTLRGILEKNFDASLLVVRYGDAVEVGTMMLYPFYLVTVHIPQSEHLDDPVSHVESVLDPFLTWLLVELHTNKKSA